MRKLVFNSVYQLEQLIERVGLVNLQRLGYTFTVPDLVLASQNLAHSVGVRRCLEQATISRYEFGHLEMAEIFCIHKEHKSSMTLSECSACFLASSCGYRLVTSDLAVIRVTEEMSGAAIHLESLVGHVQITITG